MRIDLHCHTKKTKKGDGSKRNVTPELFVEKIGEAQVGIVAITNHNHFDRDQYGALREAVKGQALVWPGIELDVRREGGSHWHMVVVASPMQVDEFCAAVEALVGGTRPDDCCWEFDEAWNVLKGLDALFISHCHDKRPCISEADIEYIREATGDDWRLYYEPSSLITLGIWSNHGRSMMMGSDVKDWNEYEKCEFASLRLAVDSFEQFFLLAKRDHHVVETLLGCCPADELPVSPYDGVSFGLSLYRDVNVLFGQKGTGKTEIVKSLKRHYEAAGVPCSCYFGGDKGEEYGRILDASGIACSAEEFGRIDGKREIGRIGSWRDASPTTLDKYVTWYSTKDNSPKKAAFKLSECQALPESDDAALRVSRESWSAAKGIGREYEDKGLSRYLDEEERASFLALLSKIEGRSRDAAVAAFVDGESTSMANAALASIKAIIDKKSETQSKPDKAGLLEYVTARIELRKAAQRILGALEPGEKKPREYLGELEGKGKLYVVTRKRYLTQGSTTAEFRVGIKALKGWRKAVEGVSEDAFGPSLPAKVKAFAQVVEDTGITDLSEFIGVEKYVVIGESEDRYDPSNGEQGILVLERKLREQADVYLLDEPELGMSNLYIDSIIRPIVQDLARGGRTVVISTHNANLAVRTLPYQSIYREHVGGGEFRTYVGNPFIDELEDIEGKAKPKRWAKTSMETLEGGSDAFYDRMTIYEAGNHED